MKKNRVLFVGTVQSSKTAFESLLKIHEVEICAVITKKKSAFNSDHFDISSLAEPHNIPFKYVKDINAPHIVEWIKTFEPDIIFVSGWSQLLHKEVLAVPMKGAIGYHPALLPYNRGRHPLIWAVELGLEKTGSTFFLLNEKADQGDILTQKEIPIDKRDTAYTLYQKMEESMTKQIPDFLPRYLKGELDPEMVDPEIGNIWRKRSRDDGLIDFRMTNDRIDALVRALTKPYPGAEIELKGQRYCVWRTEYSRFSVGNNIEPGKILNVDSKSKCVTIKSSDGAIDLVEHEIDPLPREGEYI
jgi:methionyl-tRNA formyltransferase